MICLIKRQVIFDAVKETKKSIVNYEIIFKLICDHIMETSMLK